MSSDNPESSAAEKKRLRNQYRSLFDAVSRALVEADPMGLIDIGAPDDEYESEVSTILPRLREAADASDVRRIVHEEFVKWFYAGTAGPESRYEEAANVIWSAWQEHLKR
jgi:hypothetical protein